ncbi:MAG: cysteine synthase A [Candidatus Omnitrophota bacterium]|nr:cysteine synthase A [Candidatus Omnitrophota bacterium]MDZ4242290.1 cysteine synthase A [Candidatus Omnitrophota bacterium]
MATTARKILDSVLELIGETPLVRLNRISRECPGVEIIAKVEACNPGGSVKDRACLSMLEDAEAKGTLKKGATIIEPTSGNTGIGLAMICAVKGYRCILTMPEAMSLERIYLLRLYGAEVILTPARDGIQGAIRKSEELHKKIPNSFVPRQFENDANPAAHRMTTAVEIWDACGGRIDAVVSGVGTGGTITGLGEVFKKRDAKIKIIAVEPKTSAVLSGQKAGRHNIQGIGAGFIPVILNRSIIDRVIPVDDKEAFQMTRRLGKEEGLSVGISGGAAMVAAVQVARGLPKGARVIVILPDTGERYFSIEQYFLA